MLQEYKNQIPEYAKDLKLNFSKLLIEPHNELSSAQIIGTALACAYATKDSNLSDVITNYAADKLDEAHHTAVKAAASIMAMNNIYYRFIHLSEDNDYLQMPANLRMNIIANPGVEKVDFELYSLGVSIINGCGFCVVAHSKALSKQNISKAAIQHVARIAAVINGLAQVNSIEKLSGLQ